MKNLFHRLLSSLNIGGRDWVVLLLALLLAFSTWLIHTLSLRYNDYLRVSVVARCNIEGHADVSANKCEVIARCRTTGYKVINADLHRRKVVEVTFKPGEMKHKEEDVFYVTSSDLQEYAHIFYGDDVTLDYYVSDTLFFRFPVQNFKRVPVQPIYSVSYKTQYMADGPLELEPDTVTVYGEPYLLENIRSVYTKPVKYSDVSENLQGVVALEKIKGVRISDQEVRYNLGITRFVEIVSRVPVKTVNVPSGKEMLTYPSSAEVRLKCAFPLLSDPEEGLAVVADYADYQTSLGGKCVLKLEDTAKGVIEYDSEPAVVNCVLEEL